MSITSTECSLRVFRSPTFTTAIVNGAGHDTVFFACQRGLPNRPGRPPLWYLEYCGGDDGKYHALGVFQGGPVGEYPDRERAENAMWVNLAGDMGVAAGFMSDGGG